MGRSAKLHKRQKSASKGSSQQQTITPSASAPQEQKKRAGLKAKASRKRVDGQGHVLGGADYVQLMMGGRRKALQEATKLPQDSDD